MGESCVVCRSRCESAELGRPAVYCSPACRKRRDSDLATAAKELARDSTPRDGDAAAALDRAYLLWSCWTAHTPGGQVELKDTLIGRFWGGSRPPKRLSPPSPAAVTALTGRISRLSIRVRDIEREQREQFERSQREAARREEAEMLAREKAADKAWRTELLKGA